MTSSAEVRSQLINTLRLDLVGPGLDDPKYQDEVLPISPSQWYLTGFLVPHEAPIEQRCDDDADDGIDEPGRVIESDDDDAPEQVSARKALFPSSMGLSVLVPQATAELRVRVAWGDYRPIDAAEAVDGGAEPEEGGRTGRTWQRLPREAEIDVEVAEGSKTVPGYDGLSVVVSVRTAAKDDYLLPDKARSVSVFLVNNRQPEEEPWRRDAAAIFQPELSLHALHSFVERPNLRGHGSRDWDDQVADLQYRDTVEFAVGHNVSAIAVTDPSGDCLEVRTAWMPTAEVEKVVPTTIPDVEFGMDALAAASAEELRASVGPMITEYETWIAGQTWPSDDTQRAQVAQELLANASRAKQRIQAGLEVLSDPLALTAFCITNRVIATAIRKRGNNPSDQPCWHPFQLAFVLMNLPGAVDSKHADREVVDLLFFPTGGGKTEAYLGLATFTIVLRRLRDPSIHSAGLAVIMRYTLRLLTLDQLDRAATVICALELERQQDVERLGNWPFEIGLWVGQSATPNRMGAKGKDNQYSARRRTLAFQDQDRRKPSPIPLENCPWCDSKFTKNSFQLLPNPDQPTDLRVFCSNRKCQFHSRQQARGLPILAVDEPIYRRLPAFIIATVDKFANLPWVGDTAGLFGRVDRYDNDGFYGPSHPGVGRRLEQALPPPELIIQDELHLISGPLGTMVGLFETAIDALCTTPPGTNGSRAKIVASTATVRRAEKQIRGLFGRTAVDIFPPPGPNRRDSFFAETVDSGTQHPRTYVGITAQGRNSKVVLLRTYVALLAAGQKAWRENIRLKPNPADPYMTVLGYFSSLRELGGSRRIVEDEVRSRLADYGSRRRRVGASRGLFADRKKLHDPRELTSRVNTNEVADTKRRLALTFDDDKERLDVALATNMISVGLDIRRLGLMVVLGQPKTASEYIQATSRVGRDDNRPGLVVTLLNVHRPRDRSHYETFRAWHSSFYRAVEASSVTPFSPRAIDRGIAGVAVALARLGHPGMTAPLDAAAIKILRDELDFVAEVISRRAEGHDKGLSATAAEDLRQKVRGRVVNLLDTWLKIAEEEGELQYQSEVGRAQRLLFDPLDSELDKRPKQALKFKAQRSMRDVEPSVNLWLKRPEEYEPGSSR